MIAIQKHISKLGLKVKERVTGIEGVVTSVGFDLYGCVQALGHPGTDKEGKILDQHWFDIARLEVLDGIPVMQQPNYDFGLQAEGLQGASEKPIFNKA